MAIETPCVKICVLDPVRKSCSGCGRTLEEIARWSIMSTDERRRILDDLPRRRAQGIATVADPACDA